jgi:hypothetical protein
MWSREQDNKVVRGSVVRTNFIRTNVVGPKFQSKAMGQKSLFQQMLKERKFTFQQVLAFLQNGIPQRHGLAFTNFLTTIVQLLSR